HRGQERLCDLSALERGFEVFDIGSDGDIAYVFERFNTEEHPRMMTNGSASPPIEVLGKLNRVSTEDRGRFMIGTDRLFDKAAESLSCVAGKIRFAEFAVVDDVDTAIALFLHGSCHGATNSLGISHLIIGLPFIFCDEHLH